MKNESNVTKKIAFFQLPPAVGYVPSMAFSILKSFMKHHGTDADVFYLNKVLEESFVVDVHGDVFNSMKRFYIEDLSLIPYLAMISDERNDSESMKRILFFLSAFIPALKEDENSVQEFLSESIQKIRKVMQGTLKKINPEKYFLVGFTSKFHQWIPAMIVAGELKNKYPGLKIVLGGLRDSTEACAIMKIADGFDYAIWGEGEYPLLELCRYLNEGRNDIKMVPRMVHRIDENLKVNPSKSDYINFDEYVFPDHSDFIDMASKYGTKTNFKFYVESSRGCSWSRCKFCYLNAGYKIRTRNPENLLKEIEILHDRFGSTEFIFTDTNIIGPDMRHFERLLDIMTDLSVRKGADFLFSGEIIHSNLSADIIKKMAIAGFRDVQIGYEALTDDLLHKMNKKTDFADHILFMKFALKSGIYLSGANIIKGVVGETKDDVINSMNNLHFLRFFLGPDNNKFGQLLIQLRLQFGSRFFHQIDPGELKEWDQNTLYYLFPDCQLNDKEKFSLFSFESPLKNAREWIWFENANSFYEEKDFTYKIVNMEGVRYYYEYRENKLINRICFDEPEHWEVLEAANERIVSLDELSETLKEKKINIKDEKLKKTISDLKMSYLLYANQSYSRIVSVIDTNSGNW